MKEVLYKLDALCNSLKVEYALTGTAALSLVGFPTSYRPQDIDILVTNSTEEQRNEFSKLQFLASKDKPDYSNTICYSFNIEGVKVNTIITTDSRDKLIEESNMVSLLSKYGLFSIRVQKVDKALEAKVKLGRVKDKEFIWDSVNTLLAIGYKQWR